MFPHRNTNSRYSTTGLEYEVVQVTERTRNFKEEHELEIVQKLLMKHSPHLRITERVDYSCVILDKESKNLLLKWVPPPQGWIPKAHHMTINQGRELSLRKYSHMIICFATRLSRTEETALSQNPRLFLKVATFHEISQNTAVLGLNTKNLPNKQAKIY